MIELTLALQREEMRGSPSNADNLPDFRVAARTALGHLQHRFGFECWAVTRRIGDEWVVVEVVDRSYGLYPGHAMPWTSSLCSRMVAGLGPRIAPRLSDHPVYAQAPHAQMLPISAYAGVPLAHEGTVFGAVCGFSQAPASDRIVEELPLLELVASMLGTILAHETRSSDLTRRVVRAEVEAMVDPLTELGTRLAWNRLLAEEEARCRRNSRPACVLTLDLDGLKRTNDTFGHDAGDQLLRRAAHVLRQASRLSDHVVRFGGDEFGVLAVECDAAAGEVLMGRMRQAMADAEIEVSMGLAVRDPDRGLEQAWHEADAAMYADKRARRGLRPSPVFIEAGVGTGGRRELHLRLPPRTAIVLPPDGRASRRPPLGRIVRQLQRG